MYVNKDWAQTQFENFSKKVSSVFVKAKELKMVAFSGKYKDLEGRITLTNNLLATVSGQSALDAALGPAINTKIESINPLNGFYDTSEGSVFDSHISDVSFISQHPSGIFGHSNELSDISGYWVNVISYKTKNFPQISQVAHGKFGTAFRFLDHGSGMWTNWTSLQQQINQLNSDLSFAKKLRLSVQYIDALNEEQNGSFYYDFVTKEELPTYPAPIAQNSYYNDNKILGTRKINNNTIRIYFSDKNNLPLTASILYHV